MDLEIIAAGALGCSFGLMFKSVLDAIESNVRMKMMIQGALDHEQSQSSKKKTQK